MSEWYHQLWWRGRPSGAAYRALSTLLAPAEGAYRVAISARAWAYDRGWLKSAAAPIPTLVIGNLTVGGTGKTPVTAWFADRLRRRGRVPAIVMRGYGGDEVKVHRMLNSAVPVHVSTDRVTGVRRASERGADIAVLDDAFQHRAIRADANVVLVAVEGFMDSPRLLPRGPWREPLQALDRATLVVITRKVASQEEAASVSQRLAELEPALPRAQAHIGLSGIARYDGASGEIGEPVGLDGFRCALAVAGVANPETVWAQLREAGASVDRCRAFADHHRYTQGEIAQITREAAGGPLVTTLKDAVKLGQVLPAELEMYVPLQQVIWESGEEEIECLLANLSSGP